MKQYSLSAFIFLFAMTSLKPVEQKNKICKRFIQNEATLTISGPGFDKDAKYIFLPDMLTVGGYNKLDAMTKIGFTRTFVIRDPEYLTLGIDVDLFSHGTVPLDPPKTEPQGHVSIVYRKLVDGGNSTLDISMLSVSGAITIDTYTAEYIKGSFKGNFETADDKKYTAQCDFKIMKNN